MHTPETRATAHTHTLASREGGLIWRLARLNLIENSLINKTLKNPD